MLERTSAENPGARKQWFHLEDVICSYISIAVSVPLIAGRCYGITQLEVYITYIYICNFSASDHRGHHVLTDSGPFRHKEVQKRRMSRSVALGRAPLLNCHW